MPVLSLSYACPVCVLSRRMCVLSVLCCVCVRPKRPMPVLCSPYARPMPVLCLPYATPYARPMRPMVVLCSSHVRPMPVLSASYALLPAPSARHMRVLCRSYVRPMPVLRASCLVPISVLLASDACRGLCYPPFLFHVRPLMRVPDPVHARLQVGDTFGPSWSTHWFRVEIQLPEDFAGQH